MKKLNLFLFIFLPVLVVSGCGKEKEKDLVEKYDEKVKCKFIGGGSMYEDTLYLHTDYRYLTWSSTNKNKPTEIYDLFRIDNGFIVKGMKTYVGLDKQKTRKYEELYYLLTKTEGYGKYDIFYYEDFDTDPFKLMVCY